MDDGRVHVRVPATSANLGSGFDTFGLALGLYDDVTAVRTSGTAVTVEVSGEGADVVPRDERHLVVRAMYTTFDGLGSGRPGLSLTCRNRIPHGRGLGSSAAAVVAGVLLARELARRDLDTDSALALAARLEGHPDNAAAALLGGFTLAWQDAPAATRAGPAVHAVRLEPSAALRVVVAVPDTALSTETARGMLPATVPHADAAHAAGRAALLVHALTGAPRLLLSATEDRLHQGYRAAAMPATSELVQRLRTAGLAAVVSGAGPSVLVLGGPELGPEQVAEAAGRDWAVRPLEVDRLGARTGPPNG